MGTKCIIGIAMLALMVVGIFALIVKLDGWKVAVTVYAITGGLLAWVIIMAYFLTSCW